MVQFIKVTEEELKHRFDEYNALYFDNKLPIPQKFDLCIYPTKCVGWVSVTWNKWRRGFDTHFLINARLYNWTSENLRRVMLHQMIHIALKDHLRPIRWWHWIFPPKQHDKKFVRLMNELNTRYGLNITVTAKQMKTYRK